MDYFFIKRTYTDDSKGAGKHVVRAESDKAAIAVAIKHKIALPMGNPAADRAYVAGKVEESVLEKRRRGFGGSVWYEDENGNLQKETE